MSNNKSLKLRPIMFVGTGSDVGKSILNTAFCRIFLQDGYRPAPFKAQNMSLNSYPTANGLEIGRAQAVQAEACGLECCVEMNPVLLKPTSNLCSQLVLHGKPIGNKSASDYFLKTDRKMLFKEAFKSFTKLNNAYNPVVIEGAGSISEINLWDKDITNMRVAVAAEAATYLVADIDKGGVFAGVYGTMELLPKKERAFIKGIIINKFRGDIALFEEGKKILENLTGVPVVGIVPYFKDIYIEDEDSVVLDKKIAALKDDKINIVVVLLKHMSNFTDFNVLERTPEVNLIYTNDAQDIENADIVIVPGSKNTIEDIIHLRKTGLAKAIINAHKDGKSVYGICGGFQMMGQEIHDPFHVEGNIDSTPGLGILPVVTRLNKEKHTEQCEFTFLSSTETCRGYEIHMGETKAQTENPLCRLSNNAKEGYYLNDKTWGCYIHGIFDNMPVIKSIIERVGGKAPENFNLEEFKEAQYNKLADLVRKHVDLEYIYKTLEQ
ncbi:MAG: cobyric acid synthase CobQ [Bacteroidia bacterium]|nr:MAG: cobyric acid synthase CobQ [Bacteroidia bacterium]PIE86509.1 MAG: cobyric acid synthase CobQ [Bacteroidia bacterium]